MEDNPVYHELRTKFSTAEKIRKAAKEHNLKFRYGIFTAREAETANVAVEEYLRENALVLTDLQKHLMNDEEFPYLDLVKHTTSKVPYRTFRSVEIYIRWTFNPLTAKNRFKREDDIRLLELVEHKGYRWKEIGEEMEYVRDFCRKRFLNLKGLQRDYPVMEMAESVVREGVPITDAEWVALSNKLNVSKKALMKMVDKVLKRPRLAKRNDPSSVVLCAHILKHNYYCNIAVDFEKLEDFLKNCVVLFYERKEQLEAETTAAKCQEFVDKAFGTFFLTISEMDLNIEINPDDIFWANITDEFGVFSRCAKTRFVSLMVSYNIKTYADLYEACKRLCYEYTLNCIEMHIMEKCEDVTSKESS